MNSTHRYHKKRMFFALLITISLLSIELFAQDSPGWSPEEGSGFEITVC